MTSVVKYKTPGYCSDVASKQSGLNAFVRDAGNDLNDRLERIRGGGTEKIEDCLQKVAVYVPRGMALDGIGLPKIDIALRGSRFSEVMDKVVIVENLGAGEREEVVVECVFRV
jgi:hypothetical protein